MTRRTTHQPDTITPTVSEADATTYDQATLDIWEYAIEDGSGMPDFSEVPEHLWDAIECENPF